MRRTSISHVYLRHVEIVTFEDIDEFEPQGGYIVTHFGYIILGDSKLL